MMINDTILGDSGGDYLSGDAGDDSLQGGLGKDILEGGNGLDTLEGESDDDSLYGRAGSDVLLGQGGEDILFGGQDDDSLDGGDDDDYLNGEAGLDTLLGGSGNDFIDGGDNNDDISGNDGDDLIKGGDGNDTIAGGLGHDYVDAGNRDDLVSGNEGDDLLEGNEGNDSLHGNMGNDILVGGKGIDEISGGLGFDSIDLTDDSSLDIVLYDNGDGSDSVQGFDIGEDKFAILDINHVDVVITDSDTELRRGGTGINFGTGDLLMTFEDVHFLENGFDALLDNRNEASYEFSNVVVSSDRILFVTSDGQAPITQDQQWIDLLINDGYVVTIIDDDEVAIADTTDQDLVIVSKSVNNNIDDNFFSADIPFVIWKHQYFDEANLTTNSSTSGHNQARDQTQINIIDASHPLSAGLSGLVTVYSTPKTVNWGIPTEDAIKVATIANDPSRYSIFAYEAGSTLMDGSQAPKRRVGFFLDKTTSVMELGESLVDATVAWAITGTSLDQLALKKAEFDISENGGTTTATVTRFTEDNSEDLVVFLDSSDTSEATVPTSITLAAGEDSASFSITAVDDTVADGPQTVTITASAAAFESITNTIRVTDDEVASLTLSIDMSSIGENGDTATATISRNTDGVGDEIITLNNSDSSEISIPSTVVIPDGQFSIPFSIQGIDDDVVDGDQVVSITATANNLTG